MRWRRRIHPVDRLAVKVVLLSTVLPRTRDVSMADPFAPNPSSQAGGSLPTTIDVTAADFQTLVIEESMSRPVIVDFWAPWCGPCKQLGPILEAAVAKLGGRVLLAKVNTEEEQQLAAAFRISSIPFVAAVVEGQIVDQFAGLQPANAIDEWVAGLAPSKAQELLSEANLTAASDPQSAIPLYRNALAEDASLDAAKVGLARCLVDAGHRDEACQLIEELEKRGFLEPEAEQVKSILAIPVADSDDVRAAREALAAEPDNLALAVNLAEALAGSQQDAEALETALNVVRRDRAGAGQQAKEVMVHIFDRLGNGSPLVTDYRRKLATLLY